ncbi:C1QL [Mytilus coruscus]|uniref:C1QL n=1 Tax=Mytilus coruscus TaxID=42192 RepID=A0A6J8EPE7_MYTCO|nr:C1QL [Mytilus coruscus]
MGCFLVMLISSIILAFLLFQGCESISEERFLKLAKIVENQNSRISDMENKIHEQDVHIKRLNERLKYMEIKLKKTKLKYNKSDSWSSKALGFHGRHSVYQNKDSTIKESHNVEHKEPLVRNKYDVNTRQRLLVQPTVNSKIGFYAYMSQNEDNPSKHHTIIFDVQKTNVGNGYNPFSGLFTAPKDGLYAFSTCITMG